MGRMIQRLLICLLIILKELNTLEADCSCTSTSRCTCIGMGLTSIPQTLPTSISHLELTRNQITKANELLRYRNLVYVTLRENRIRNLDPFPHLPLLTSLSIEFNQITKIHSATTDVACQKSDVNNLRKLLEDHFSTNRHHVTNPAGKTAAKKFVSDTFRSYGLITWEWNFQGENKYTGTNIFAMWPGRNTGTGLDRPICLTADLDTDKNRPGRDDNGSGMAAVLEAARLITSETCIQDNTIFFAIFDFEEPTAGPDGACAAGACGSKEFNDYVVQPYLAITKVDPDQWSGIITLDSILNYNSSAMAQQIPQEDLFKEAPGLTNLYQSIKANDQKGDFIAVLYRTEGDYTLHSKFDKQWTAEGNPQYKILSGGIPYKNITDIIDAQEGKYWQLYKYLLEHDVYSFWKKNVDIPAITVSDSGDPRQREKPWGEVRPGDNMELTPDRLQFLKKTTDVVTEVIRDMAGTRQQCRDPTSEAPSGFSSGLSLSGELTLDPGKTETFTLKVSSFTSTGIVKATLSGPSWTLDFEGVGGSSLALPVILSLASGILVTALTAWCIVKRRSGYEGSEHPVDTSKRLWNEWSKRMTLKLLTTAVAILMTATTEVTCQKSDVNNLRKLLEDHFSTNRHHVTNPAGKTAAKKFVSDTFRSQYGLITWEWNFQGENKVLALPVILSLAGGILVTALTAWCIVKRRRGYEGVQKPLLGNEGKP
uniref:Peptidase M28 domain-containing protein n=1 Tax=Branchiostoma floridae TaxID=7739 RepID=C3ZXZ9_BRAFL|eukprot:XP_002586565.1 hypothetical protein BRAFLDRAFT_131384 [Branchiostoma floridae]